MSAARSAQTSRWAPSLVALCIGVVGLLALFATEAKAAVEVWYNSTAFGHCFLVLPIVGWLVWERRDRLAWLAPRPLPGAVLLMFPCGAVWLFAERLGLMEGRQLAALTMVWVLVLTIFGPAIVRALVIPLAYLIFLVPFGAFLVPALQGFTARFIDVGLGILAIPHEVNQVNIEIPEGRFLVAEACAGLRFLIASIAFGALYAASIFRSPGRRIGFLVASVVVPILANGVRALGIVLLGHVRGSAEAGAVDHVVYGWLFFSAVILLLVLIGLPFRQDLGARTPPPPTAPRLVGRGFVAAACLALVLACAGPGAAWALDQRALDEGGSSPAQMAGLLGRLAPPQGCDALRPQPGDLVTAGRFACGSAEVRVRARALGPHASASMVMAALRADAPAEPEAAEGAETEDVEHATLPQGDAAGGAWRLDSIRKPEAATAASVWLHGRPAPGGLRDRLALAWASLFGGSERRLVVSVAATGPGALAATRAMVPPVGAAIGDGS